jgi:hypothetical protein
MVAEVPSLPFPCEGEPKFGEYWCHGHDEIEFPFVRLCKQLKPRIEEGRYNLIVGDDISGRLPTLGIREYSAFVLSQLGREPLPTVFLQDKSIAKNVDSLENQVRARILPFFEEGDKGRILYVTEYVETGRKLFKAGEVFKKMGIPYDFAVLEGLAYERISVIDQLRAEGNTIMLGELVRRKSPLYNCYFSGLGWRSERIVTGTDNRGFKVEEWVTNLRGYDIDYQGKMGFLVRTAIEKAREDVHLWVKKAIEATTPQATASL